MKRLISTLLLALAGLGTAQAVPITMHFTVERFVPISGLAAPADPVTGTIVWDAASPTSAINSIVSIDLTLDGHAYALGEIGFAPGTIGGAANGPSGVLPGTDDFAITWIASTLAPAMFDYSSANTSGFWYSRQFTQFSITEGSAVPVPGTLALFAAAGVGFAARRRR